MQEGIDDRDVEAGIFERLQCRRAACCFDDFETMKPRHDRDHRANVRLVINNKNAGHQALPDRLSFSVQRKSRTPGQARIDYSRCR